MSSVFFSPAAVGDLREIHDFIFVDNTAAAGQLLDDLQQSCESLARHPRMGATRSDIMTGIRLLVVRKIYVVFYRISGPDVEVVRIVNGHRDFSKLFDL